ncbi:MAG: hypothetical protein Q7O66_18145, partial [Dehalococcoidia bacterium]|nr:hypothetical protein [Dehalococcoidia bacterium]
MKGSRRGLLVYILIVLWIAGVFAGYYAVHKPFAAESFPAIATSMGKLLNPWSAVAFVDAVLNLAVALWLGLVAYGAGRLLLRAFHLDLTRLEGLTLSTSLGLGVISMLTFFLGLTGFLYARVFYGLFVVASLAILVVALKYKDIFLKDGPQRTTIGLSSCLRVFVFENRPSLLLAIFIALTEGLALLAALTPPWAWDSLVYHLTGPQLYMAQHRIFGGLDGMHFYFPPLVEMLFLDGMLLKGPIVAGLIHWEFGLLAVGAV